MEAKEKAKQLINKFSNHCFDFEKHKEDNEYSAKQCALISVQEIINANPHSNPLNTDVYSTMEYWLQVKNEIEKL